MFLRVYLCVYAKIGGCLIRKKYEKADFKVVSLDFCDIVTASIGDGDNRRDDDIFGGDGD